MGKRLRTSRKLKAKETASEPSRKGRLSLGWSGKGCCEKKFTFQLGGWGGLVGSVGRIKVPNIYPLCLQVKGGIRSSSLFDES